MSQSQGIDRIDSYQKVQLPYKEDLHLSICHEGWEGGSEDPDHEGGQEVGQPCG